MQTFEKKNIQNKLHRYRENALLKTSSEAHTLEELESKRTLKFAPKYSRSLNLATWKDVSLINALKRIKKVDKVNEKDVKGQCKNQWRLFMQNKFKTVHVYDYDQNLNEKEVLQKYKAFLNVREMFLDMTSKSFLNKKKEANQILFTRNLLRYLPGMRNIQDVNLKISEKTDPDVLKKLNSITHFLSSLENLRITCYSDSIRPGLIKCMSILKAITHLSINSISEDEAGELFGALSEHSKDLVSLSLNINSNSELQFLKRLKNFVKLEDFQITMENLFFFMENFTPSPSLKHITIDSVEGSWKETSNKFFSKGLDELDVSAVRDLFENDKRLASYFERWNDLKNLVSLSLFIGQDSEEVSSILIFLQHFLKNIPALDTLDLYFQYCSGLNWSKTAFICGDDLIVDIRLDEVFEALQEICKKLKTLKLFISGGHQIHCSFIPSDFAFPQFTKIQFLQYSRCDSSVIKDLFSGIKGSVEKQMEISICHQVGDLDYEDDYELLLNLLKVIRKPPRNCKVAMNIDIDQLDSEKFDETLKLYFEKARTCPVAENVSLTVESSEYLEEFSFLGEMFRNVRSI